MSRQERLFRVLVPILFLTLVPAAAHLLFSSIGFNPTDDGFILAQSRRLLDGQVPHRDFIAIRPVGSPLLHVPLVRFGGDDTFWLSRLFVWFQYAAIAWSWTLALGQLLALRRGAISAAALALVAFLLSSHDFPIMAWHSVDGLFLASIGLALCLRASPPVRLTGYLLVGLACLTKQNFLLLGPTFILALGDGRRWRYWAAVALPGAIYVAFLLVAGAMPDAWLQLSAQTNFRTAGFKPYVFDYPFPWGLIWGFAATALAGGDVPIGPPASRMRWQRGFGALMLAGMVVALGLLWRRYFEFERTPAFGLFGAALGATAYLLFKEQQRAGPVVAGILVLATAWSTSISIGYKTPALAAGPLAVLLVGHGLRACRAAAPRPWLRWLVAGSSIVVLAALAVNYTLVRQNYVYRDRPARELTASLDGIFSGARSIKTNVSTSDFLVDLQRAVDRAGERPYAIIPDLAAYWVQAPRRNPLPIDWPQGTELSRPALVERVTRDLAARRGSLVVIVQKVRADGLANGFVPLPDSAHYAVVQYVWAQWTKTGETTFFELFE